MQFLSDLDLRGGGVLNVLQRQKREKNMQRQSSPEYNEYNGMITSYQRGLLKNQRKDNDDDE